MAVGYINIGKSSFTFVFRHKFEKHDNTVERIRFNMEWRRWEIGLWYKFSKIVGRKEFKNPNKWSTNLVGSHMFGISLLICKAWVEYCRGGLYIDEK